MSAKTSSLIAIVLIAFALLFTIICTAQYLFVRARLNAVKADELRNWASDLKGQIAYKDGWDLRGYDRTSTQAPVFIVATRSGLLVDVEGFIPGIVPTPVSLPFPVVYDQPFTVVSEANDEYRIYARKIVGGTLLLGSVNHDRTPDIDDRLRSNAPKFGNDVVTASKTSERQIDSNLEYAIVDKSGRLLQASGGIPLKVDPADLRSLVLTKRAVTLEAELYAVRSEPIDSSSGTEVGSVTVFDDIGPEQRVLRDTAIFNVAVATLAWLITGTIILAYLRRYSPVAMTCEQALSQKEGRAIELKSSLRWDYRTKGKNSALERSVVKTVAGFLNADGGTLLIGVKDDGSVLGLEPDYQTLNEKPNRDGFELTLIQTLSNAIGVAHMERVRIEFCEREGKEICALHVARSKKPIFVVEKTTLGPQDTLYVRFGNATKALSAKDTASYVVGHWGALVSV